MRSRAEWALRGVALTALALLIWTVVRPAALQPRISDARGGLETALVNATRRPVAALDVVVDSVPTALHRDWLAAIRAAGTKVSWSGRALPPVAVATSPVAEPESRIRVSVAGGDSTEVVLSDQLGAIDTVQARAIPSSRLLRTATGWVSASARGSRAVTAVANPVQVRRVLVLASAGWESKFVVAALEEAGWTVDARLRIAPGVETRQGPDYPLDTARYSAVIALDAAAAPSAGAIERYVNAGGGAVLAGPASRLPGLARISPAAAGARRVAGPRTGLVLGALKDDAVVLERQGALPLVAARRSGVGRVIASGYDETWRSRMRRAAEAPDEHREWWTALVSAVAFVPTADARASGGDAAPVAALTAALGPQSQMGAEPAGARSLVPPVWMLFGALLASLLGEVVSRRYRGLA